jgi:YHS domain-containing protein
VIRFLLLAILVLIAARLLWRVLDAVLVAAGGRPPAGARRPVKLQRDPVCGTFVPPEGAPSLTSGKTTFYFCSEDCRSKFELR